MRRPVIDLHQYGNDGSGHSLIISTTISSYIFGKNNGRKSASTTTFVKKKDFSEKSVEQSATFPLRVSKKFLSQSVVAILGLGFIDAGYSGDWSRIGIISKEGEDLLKLGAFVIVPLFIFFIFSISTKIED